MNTSKNTFCLDANVLIQAWQTYYSPQLCPDYWDVLNELGLSKQIFIPEEVKEEITRTDDDLAKWLKKSKIPIHKSNETVVKCLTNIFNKDPIHKLLVDNIKGRSLADPWLIAHAMSEGAIVVTKENKNTALNSKRIKIPNVCEKMGVLWLNDFKFIAELNIKFNCKKEIFPDNTKV